MTRGLVEVGVESFWVGHGDRFEVLCAGRCCRCLFVKKLLWGRTIRYILKFLSIETGILFFQLEPRLESGQVVKRLITINRWCLVALISFSVSLTQVIPVSSAPTPGTLRIMNGLDILTLDPPDESALLGIATLHNIYDTLLKYDFESGEIIQGIAKTWTVSKDLKEFTFVIDSSAKFADGMAITSSDVVWSLQRILDWPTAILRSQILSLIGAKLIAKDDSTVVITTLLPQPTLLAATTGTAWSIINSKLVISQGTTAESQRLWLKSNTAGSGKYVVAKWERGSHILLSANKKYWGKIEPMYANVQIKFVKESLQQVNALKNGDVDVAMDIQPQQLSSLKKAKLKVISGNDGQTYYIGLNQKIAPFDNVKVREAIKYAIDYHGIINGMLLGRAVKAGGIIAKGWLGHDPTLNTLYSRNIGKARRLLVEAGFSSGFTMDLYVDGLPIKNLGIPTTVLATKIQGDLAKIGITVNVIQQDITTLFPAYRAGGLQSILWSFGAIIPDPDPIASAHGDFNVQATTRLWAKQNDFVTASLIKARSIADPQERDAIYKQVGKVVSGPAGPYVFIFRPLGTAVTQMRTKGFHLVPMFTFEID